MASSLVLEVENLTIGETNEEEQQNDFQTIFDEYYSADIREEAYLTCLLLSYLEDLDDPKTMATFQTVARKYKDCIMR